MFLTLTGGAMLTARVLWSVDSAPKFPAMLDHILLGCRDLDEGIAFVEQHTGVGPMVGGVHPGRGTRNALLSLGKMHYLEIIAPDPAQASMAAGPPSMLYTLRHLEKPRIVTWAMHTINIESVAQRLRQFNIAFAGPTPGSRKRPDAQMLHWQTLNLNDDQNGMLPFFIQWGDGSPHPSIDAPSGCRLESLGAVSPAPQELSATLQRLGLEVQVKQAAKSELRARIVGTRGTLKLSS
jgi:hypothetical protein